MKINGSGNMLVIFRIFQIIEHLCWLINFKWLSLNWWLVSNILEEKENMDFFLKPD